jgi:hypothetical protein
MNAVKDESESRQPSRKRQIAVVIVLLTVWSIGNPYILLNFAWADGFVIWQDARRLEHCVNMLGSVEEGWNTPMVWLAAAIGGTRISRLSDEGMRQLSSTKPAGGSVLYAQCRAIDAITRHPESDLDRLRTGGWGETFEFGIGHSGTVERIEHGLVSIN